MLFFHAPEIKRQPIEVNGLLPHLFWCLCHYIISLFIDVVAYGRQP